MRATGGGPTSGGRGTTVSADMDDATVDELAATALPAWHDFKFEVQRLRADYLLRRADGQSAE